MIADIFISYSRNDSSEALALTERLRTEGFTVWIDQQGIGAATSWSGEIVDAIEGCTVFIVLLSGASVKSENVIRELNLAFENKRKIIPVETEKVELPREFKYHLAGIQRTSLDQVDSIVAAVLAGGAVRGEPGVPSVSKKTKRFPRLSLGRKFRRIPNVSWIAIAALVIAVSAIWFFLHRHAGNETVNDGFSPSAEANWHKYASKIPEANELFERAVNAKNMGDSAHDDEARRLFENAIAVDSNFALAYVNLAGTYSENDSADRATARRLARKALLLDPNLPAAYAMAGFIALEDHDTTAAFEYGNKGVALSDSTSNMSWSVLRACFVLRKDYGHAYAAEQGSVRASSGDGHESAPYYLAWISRNQDSLASLYPAKWIESWIKLYRKMPQQDFLLYVIVTALGDLEDPHINEYLPKLKEKSESDPNAVLALAFYNMHYHNDAELLKNLQALKTKWAVPKMLTENTRFKEYRSKPEFQEYIRISK